ncbi:hypothetical protein CN388_25620 [Bacillus cereus]|nr:hypothetical protein CN388_25620 [Bacillus cereus]
MDKEVTKSALSVKVDVDTKEANESIRELTAVANECVEAFERLEKIVSRFEKKPVQTLNFNPVIKTTVNASEMAEVVCRGTRI